MYLNGWFFFKWKLSINLIPVLIITVNISLDLFYLPGFRTDYEKKLIK